MSNLRIEYILSITYKGDIKNKKEAIQILRLLEA